MSRYKQFFGAYNESVKNGNPLSKEDVVSQFTEGRTESLKELSDDELTELTASLKKLSKIKTEGIHDTKSDKMRKAIISIFYKMKRTPKDAIEWAEKQGVKGQKKAFNDYTPAELYTLIIVAEKVLSDWQNAIRKQVATI